MKSSLIFLYHYRTAKIILFLETTKFILAFYMVIQYEEQLQKSCHSILHIGRLETIL